MTNAILKGKPYAGNPHVRFDERTAHRLAAVLAIALAFATGGASAADPYYWTGATSADYNTAENWSSNRVAVATYAPYWRWASTPMYFETADIVSYRIEFGNDSYARGHWYINAGTETQPLEFYCANDKTLVSPDCKTYNYASGLNIALTSDSWVWINGGQWDAFTGDATIGSSDYAAHLLIGNDRNVATTFVVATNNNSNGSFYLNQGSVVVSNATMNIGRKLHVGNTDIVGKLTSFDFCNSTMVVGDYFDVKNYATFDLCGGSITNAAKYLTVDYSGKMTIRNGGRYSCQQQIIVGNYSTGTLNIIDGGEAASGSNLALGYRDGSSGTVNIANGGILTVPYIHLRHTDASATVALDGGTIRAAKDNERLIRSANNLHVTVGANGGTIDAAGYNVTIEEDLDNASGETGAMTFKGGGTVTLSGAINYTGCTTVEVGTTLIVKSAIAGDKLAFTIPNGLADGVYEVVRISGSDEKFAENVLDNVTQSPTALFVLNSARTGIYLYKGLVEGDDKVWTGTAGDGKLSSAENWLDGKQPVAGDVLNFSAVTANLALNADLGEIVPATMVFGTKLITITNGTLTVNTLTNASKLAVASTGSLTVTGDLVATVESNSGSQTFLHSNEGTVTVGGKAIGYTNVGGSSVFEYAAVTENTRPIQASGIAYKCGGSGQLYMKLQSDGKTAGSWVVGADGFSFPSSRNANYTTFFAESAAVTLYSADNWTLANSTKNNTTRGDLYVSNASGSSLAIDTSDYVTPETRRTVTLEGRIVAYNPVTIKGGGTVVVDTTGSSTDATVPEDFRHTCLTNSATLYVTDTATLQVNAGKKITGNGTVSLAAGTTLALASTGREFATPEIVPVTLPAEGAATINIDGTRLRGGEHVLCTLASVPENLADHVTVTGTAIDSRKYEVTDNDGKLVLNIYPDGLMIIVR